MDKNTIWSTFSLAGKTALLTGGGGVLGAVFARTLAQAGAKVWVTDLSEDRARQVAGKLCDDNLEADSLAVDVMDRRSLESAAERVGNIDILLNAAGGNVAAATTSNELSFFDLPQKALSDVVGLNFFGGAVLPAQVFSRAMVDRGGVILNITSMNALRPLTRIPGYSAAKAAVSNFTQWLAVHMAQEYNPAIRVNAIAPGFFLTNQNRFLLTDSDTGKLTPRGQSIVDHTPMGRFGEPDELAGVTLWLCSPAASFVTGAVIPVDGGFSAYSGV